MKFSEQLKAAMQQLGINQSQVVGMTGIGKSSISQYLSDSNVPTEERQKHIAVSLVLPLIILVKKINKWLLFQNKHLMKVSNVLM